MVESPYFLLFISVSFASFSQILLKRGAMGEYASFWREYLNPWVICGYFLLLGSVFLTILALRKLEYLNAPVMESFGYVFVPVLSAFFFRERLTLRKLLGIGCIVAGMIVFYI